MKHLIDYRLFEFKRIGDIYHFTTFDSLEGILEENRMESSAVVNHISFTRNPSLDFHGRNVRIEFDGDSMSDRFHFEPFLYNPDTDPLFGGTSKMDYQTRRKMFGQEREERIKKTEITNIKKYITAIDIIRSKKDEDFDERLNKMKSDNPHIHFSVVEKFATRAAHRMAA